METVNLNQLIASEGSIYLLGGVPFSGFAIETFPDGRLETQMPLMRGLHDGVTRRWHPNGQLKSEQSFRAGAAHGRHHEWRPDGVLEVKSRWNAGECGYGRRFDEQGRFILEVYGPLPPHPRTVTYQYYDIGEAGGSADDPQPVIYQYDADGNRIEGAETLS